MIDRPDRRGCDGSSGDPDIVVTVVSEGERDEVETVRGERDRNEESESEMDMKRLMERRGELASHFVGIDGLEGGE